MKIVLFEDFTTEKALLEIEEKSKDYKGLYVDMNNAPERKYVKEMAAEINGMLKKLDRARIDKAKEYKGKVEKEAESIRIRLEEANSPFTMLIDAHKKERQKILDAEKAEREAKELAEQIEKDHEMALLMDAEEMRQRERLAAEKIEYEKALKAEAEEKAIRDYEESLRLAKQKEEEEAKQRLNDVEHKRKVNNEAADAIATCLSISKDEAKKIVVDIAKGLIPNVSISY